MDPIVTVSSTTDSPDQVRAALGVTETQAPAEPAAPAAPAPGAPVPGAPAAPAANGFRRPPKLTAKQRIQQLTGRSTELSEENLALKRRLSELESGRPAAGVADRSAQPAAPPVEQPPTPEERLKALGAKPKQEDFDSVEAYLDARDEWMEKKAEIIADQKADERFRTIAQERQREEMQRVTNQNIAAFNERVAQVTQILPDYTEVVKAADMKVTQAIGDFIFYEEEGPIIGYYLCKHPEELKRIMAMPQAGKQLTALGRLVQQLDSGALDIQFSEGGQPAAVVPAAPAAPTVPAEPAAPAGPAARVAQPNVSRAPNPAPRISGGAAAPADSLTKVRDYQDYKRLRRQGVTH